MVVIIAVAVALAFIVLLVRLNSIEEKKEEQRKQEQAEQKRIADIQAKKLASEKAAEVERLKKIEDEKYETVLVVSTSINAEGKHQAYFKRADNTYVSVISTVALTVDSSLKQLKEKTNQWTWFSATAFERLKTKAEQQKAFIRQQEQVIRNRKQQDEQQEFPQICEINTEYSNCLSRIIRLDCTQPFALYPNIQNISKDCKVWDELGRGVNILSTPEQLSQYIYSYGKMHKAKLNEAFETCINAAHYKPEGEKISIIDYGCGQGLGTVAFIDFLYAHTNFNCDFKRIILIEPSAAALKRASFHVYALLGTLEKKSENISHQVVPLIKTIDEITNQDLETNDISIKFHIFSNVLDIPHYDLQSLCKKIASTQKGENYFICVSPNMHSSNIKLDNFINYFLSLYQVTVISQRSSNVKNSETKTWTRYEKVFKSSFLNKMTQEAQFSFQMADDDLPF